MRIVYLVDRQPQPSQRGCVCWKLNDQPLYLAGDLVLLAFFEWGFQDPQDALDRFSGACDQAGMKISTKKAQDQIFFVPK